MPLGASICMIADYI